MKTAVFFHGQYVYRTFSGTMSVIVPLLASAAGFVAAPYNWTRDDELLTVLVSAIFAAVASLFGGLGLWRLWNWVQNRRVPVEINADGIIYGNRFWQWDRVRSFAGTRYKNGIVLRFVPRRGVWGDGSLPTTPLLTEQQYIELAQDLSRFVSARYPDVVVTMHPLKASAEG